MWDRTYQERSREPHSQPPYKPVARGRMNEREKGRKTVIMMDSPNIKVVRKNKEKLREGERKKTHCEKEQQISIH